MCINESVINSIMYRMREFCKKLIERSIGIFRFIVFNGISKNIEAFFIIHKSFFLESRISYKFLP